MTDLYKLLQIAEDEAVKLPDLSLSTEHAPNLPVLGAHRKRRGGKGGDFWQFEGYDPLRHEPREISWRRSDLTNGKLLVQQKEEQVTQAVYVWCDNRPDMHYSHSPATHISKADEAKIIALMLTLKLGDCEENVGYLGSNRMISRRVEAMVNAMQELPEQDENAWKNMGEEGRAPISRSGAVLISDFSEDISVIAEKIDWLAGRKMRGHLLQVLDPAEINLPFEGRKAFYSASGHSYELQSPEKLRETYYQRMHEKQKQLIALADAAGWTYSCHITGQDRGPALLPVYEQTEPKLPAFSDGLAKVMKNPDTPAKKSRWPRFGF